MMKYLEDLREAVCKELERFAKSGEITSSTLDKIHKLTDIIKNIDKIEMLEENGYSEDWAGEGRIYGTSYARGRSTNAKRDSMGRYSRDERHEYSRAEAKERLLDKLNEMADSADPKERETLRECMKMIE